MKRVLVIGGSDSGGGAGIQADLKTLHSLGVHGSVVVTAVTAQNSLGVQGWSKLPAHMIKMQLDSVLQDIGADAVKTGMLPSEPAVRAVVAAMRDCAAPLVVDPVAIASTGRLLATEVAREMLRDLLLPIATVLTPNLAEVAELTGFRVTGPADLPGAADAVLALGPRWVLVKGGHLPGPPTDYLAGPQGRFWLTGSRIETPHTHGTGCTMASALAAGLAAGLSVEEAARQAKRFVTAAIAGGYPLGIRGGPVHPGSGWAGVPD